MGQVIISTHVEEKIKDLLSILYDEGYFAFRENAQEYIRGLRFFISNLHSKKYRKTKNDRYGVFYATYKPNRRTHYYITFDKEDNIYLVKNIFTNHTKDYPLYIELEN